MQMPQISRGRALAYVAALLVVLVVGGRLAFTDAEGQPEHPAVVAMRASPAPAKKLIVHVVGGVRRPGLYRLDDGSRVDDAIRIAGGPKPKAALELINLAAPVADGEQVVVPLKGKAGTVATAEVPGAPPEPMHLNSATLEELDTLPGIGPVTAQKILDYRTEHGAFSSVDELDSVPGIGPARLAELKDLVDL
jgi:competence protein ComEA